jgi:hypothetical protein
VSREQCVKTAEALTEGLAVALPAH